MMQPPLRGPNKFQPAPLFESAAAPFKRASLAGYAVDDLVELPLLGNPGRFRLGRVINILHRHHVLLIRVETPAPTIVEFNPVVHPHLLRHKKAGGR
jgi:hypothetical protein